MKHIDNLIEPIMDLHGSKRFGVVCLIALSVQNVLHTLSMRYSRTQSQKKFFTSSVVILSECFKLIFSSLVLFQEGRLKQSLYSIYYDPFDFFQTSVPAFIYVIQNSVLFYALSLLDTAVFQVTYQLKLLTTTMFSVIILGKRIGTAQWISQVVLFFGVAVVQLQDHISQPTLSVSRPISNTPGLIAVVFASFLSGFAAVYFEMVLKNSPKSLWARNFDLSLASVIIAILVQFMNNGGVYTKGFFYGFNWLVWTTVALQSIGGIIVALVVKYSDNIQKGFACSCSIVITCFLSVAFFDTHLSWMFFLGTSCVVAAVFLYSAFPVRQ
uniref:UDP-N-acetylglucosamine transporter n=2 Tax=Mesocestoides corti TaxID=53468 RepID=A0A5K3F265_MESCO